MLKHRNDIILEVILNKINCEYRDDVSLVCCYGSYINGTANEKSDIDIYFVPKTDRAYELSKTFILDGIGFDFWGLSWERLEKISNFDDTLVSLIVDSKIVYCNFKEDEKRFLDLRNKIEDIQREGTNENMLYKAENHIKLAMAEYCKILVSCDICDIRASSGILLIEISTAVSLMNNSYFSYGIKKQLSELLLFKKVPIDFELHYCSIIQANTHDDIKDSCLKMINSTYSLWKQMLHEIQSIRDPKDVLPGLYEEISSIWRKIYIACDNKDANLAFLAGTYLQKELDSITAFSEFPKINLMSDFRASNLELFKEAAKQSEKTMLEILRKADINIERYDSVDEFRLNF